MQPYLVLHKSVGQTPLACVTNFRQNNQKYKTSRLGYAGRLDPMAEGLLLVLVGEENKKRAGYLILDKKYDVEFILGISTDSYDVLGKVTQIFESKIEIEQLEKILKKFQGEIMQPPPPFSAYRLQGKPMYYWARQGSLAGKSIPQLRRKIYNLIIRKKEVITVSNLQQEVLTRLSLVQGNFRQQDIRKIWETTLQQLRTQECWKITCTVHCSSGTYIRALVHDIGTRLGCGAFTLALKRTAIGQFTQPS